jgi:hypothetical protein
MRRTNGGIPAPSFGTFEIKESHGSLKQYRVDIILARSFTATRNYAGVASQ